MPVAGKILPPVFERRYEQFLSETDRITLEEEDVILRSKLLCALAQQHLHELKQYVTTTGFSTLAEEIFFFKTVKPLFQAPFLYHRKVHFIELNRPVGNIEIQETYLQSQVLRVKQFFDNYTSFYQYFRSGETAKDQEYFTRGHLSDMALQYPFTTEADPTFSTGYDYLLARTQANDLTNTYLNRAVYALHHPSEAPSQEEQVTIQWTSPAIDLAEFIYGAIADGFINNGKTPASTLARVFGKFFNVNLAFIHKKMEEIRNRKKNRSVFWDRGKRSLVRKMEEDDEHAL